jgi:HK97 gp10 family phage protein
MVASMSLQGFKDLDALLREMPRQLAGQAVTSGMRKALQPVAAAARAYAPGSLDTRIRIAPTIKAGQMPQALEKPGKGKRVMFVGATAPHAHLVEFGTGPRYHANGKYVGVMPPDPFLRPAWDANKDQVLATLAEVIREEIGKAIGRRSSRAIKAGY